MEEGLSIIIVNYNGAKFLENCIRSYQDFLIKERIRHEFLIIDNASTDESVLVVGELSERFGCIRPFFSNVNHGFSKGNNLLVQEARFKTLIFLNNDTETIDLSNLCKKLNSSGLNENTIYTCKILNENLTRQKNVFNYPKLIYTILDVFLIKRSLLKIYNFFIKPNEEIGTGYFSGCYLAINKDLFLSVGGFDEAFFFYHEECDLFMRLESLALKKEILDDKIIHFGSGGGLISDFSFKNYYLNLARLLIKHNFGSVKLIKTVFKLGFKFRIILLILKIKISYSPFSNIYLANRSKSFNRNHVIKLHQDTVESINNITLS